MRVLLSFTIICLMLSGCSSTLELSPAKRAYQVAEQQLPQEPTYNRLRWVHLPTSQPARSLHRASDEVRPKLLPVVHFSIKEKSLCEAATILAGLYRFSSYCSSQLREEMITLEALGNIYELAENIAADHDVKIVIDRENREIRFFPSMVQNVRFLEEVTNGN
ncbi:hypothetical protein EBR25_03440 [bacterium]|nr:hypothetical protein [bacterium]